MPTKHITNFGGGMTNSSRLRDSRAARFITHFDILTDSHKLSPFYGNVADGSTGDTEKLVKFLVGSDGKQYGLGVKSGSVTLKIFERTPPTGTWTASTTGESAGGTRSENAFVDYKDVIYGFASGADRVWSYAYLTNTLTETVFTPSATVTSVAQGLVHSKTDILYMAFNNIVVSKDGASSFVDPALTLPTNMVITDMCEYGNYLAIAAKSKILGGNSVVYLWDMDSSLNDISEKIDWGTGSIQLIESFEGSLIGVSNSAPTSVVTTPKVMLSYYNGATVKKLLEFPTSSLIHYFGGKQKVDNRILFGMSVELGGVNYDGVWSLGKSIDGNLALSLDTLITNTPSTLSNRIKGFQLLGNYITIAYQDDDAVGDPYKIVRTGTGYTFSSVYESLINPKVPPEEMNRKKTLMNVAVQCSPLTSGQEIKFYCKVDGGSWIQVFDETTVGKIVIEAVDISGLKIASGRELEFKIESIGGAIPTGFSYNYKILPTLI